MEGAAWPSQALKKDDNGDANRLNKGMQNFSIPTGLRYILGHERQAPLKFILL